MVERLVAAATPLLAVLAVACVDESVEEPSATDTPVETVSAPNSDVPAYVVFNYEISDREAYDPYLMQVPRTLEAYGAEVIVADFESDAIEGEAGRVTVVLKFASEDLARGWYESPEYQEIIELRTANSSGIASLASVAED